MDVLQPSQDLVEEELTVLIGELLVALDYSRQVGLHQFRNNVNIFKVLS